MTKTHIAVALALLVAACHHDEPAPPAPLHPEPEVRAPLVPTAPVPTLPGPPVLPAPPAPPVAPVAPVAPEATADPAVPVAPEAIVDPTLPEVPPGPIAEDHLVDELETTTDSFRIPNCRICADDSCSDPCTGTFGHVALPTASADRALALRVRADLLAANARLLEDNHGKQLAFTSSCVAVLALPEIVSYECQQSSSVDERSGDWTDVFGLTYRIDAAGVHALDVADALVDDANVSALARSCCRSAGARPGVAAPELNCSLEPQLALKQEGVAVFSALGSQYGDEGDEQVIPYPALGKLLRPGGVLTVIPHALDHVADDTALARIGAPPPVPATVKALGNEGPLTALALTWLRVRGPSLYIAVPRGETADTLAHARLVAADQGTANQYGTALALPVAEVPWPGVHLSLEAATLQRAIVLRDGPGSTGRLRHLPAGSRVVLVLGDVAGRDSALGSGLWAYAVVSGTTQGWMPGAGVQNENRMGAPDLTSIRARTRDALLAAAPADVRGAVGDDAVTATLAHAGATVGLAYATTSDGARSWLVVQPASGAAGTFPLAGRIDDVLVGQTAHEHGEDLLYVSTIDVGAPVGQRTWRVYRWPASGAPTVAPVLTTTLVSGDDAPTRTRARLALGATLHRVFYPLVVRGPGTTQTPYAWDGAALTPPPPPPAP